MKKNLFFLGLFLVLNNCGGFEMVYKTNSNIFFVKNNAEIIVEGDSASKLLTRLKSMIGDNKDNFPKYRILVSSVKTETADVIKKDATASKFNIKYSVKYDIYNLYKNCKLYGKEINTVSGYNVKSAGYSFGTQLSQKESVSQNIDKNINKFFSSLREITDINSCEKN